MKYNSKQKGSVNCVVSRNSILSDLPTRFCGAPEVNDDIQAHRILKNQGLCPLSTRIRNRCCVFQSCIQQ